LFLRFFPQESYQEENGGKYNSNSNNKVGGGYSRNAPPSIHASSLDDYYNQQDAADRTIRRVVKQPENAGYQGLQDAPSPSGKLSDRIERLRQRCMEALGRDAFMDAYNYLKQHELVLSTFLV
jgi:hypothetical protein